MNLTDGATPWRRGGSFQKFLETLPDILAGETFKSVVSAIVTARIQECHITLGHVLCEFIEERLFGDQD